MRTPLGGAGAAPLLHFCRRSRKTIAFFRFFRPPPPISQDQLFNRRPPPCNPPLLFASNRSAWPSQAPAPPIRVPVRVYRFYRVRVLFFFEDGVDEYGGEQREQHARRGSVDAPAPVAFALCAAAAHASVGEQPGAATTTDGSHHGAIDEPPRQKLGARLAEEPVRQPTEEAAAKRAAGRPTAAERSREAHAMRSREVAAFGERQICVLGSALAAARGSQRVSRAMSARSSLKLTRR